MAKRMVGRHSPTAGGTRRIGGTEIAALVVLAGGAVAGLVLWAKWGFLIAFDAVTRYCF